MKQIIVNGRTKNWNNNEITAQEVFVLAFGHDISFEHPNRFATITYTKAENNTSGSMIKGDAINIQEGTIFNITVTDKS